MDTWIIVLGIVIVVILFYLIRYYFFTTASLATNLHLGAGNAVPADISSNLIKNPSSILYSFGAWVYVNNFTNSIIYSYTMGGFSGVNDNTKVQFALALGGTQSTTTSIKSGIYNSPTLSAIVSGTSGQSNSLNTVTITNNFPIQKWVHVLVAVDTLYVDCYLDGKLVISSPVKNQITKSPNTPPAITFAQPTGWTAHGDMYVTKLTRWDHPLDPQSVYNEYSAGNGLSQGGNLTVGLFVNNDAGNNNYKIYSNV